NIQQTSGDIGTNPYSIAEAFDMLFATNGPAGTISVIDKAALTQMYTFTVGSYPQEIISIGNRVFICNTSSFSGPEDSTVSVYDASVALVVAVLKVNKDPSSIAEYSGKVLIGSSSTNSYIYLFDLISYNKLDSFFVADG